MKQLAEMQRQLAEAAQSAQGGRAVKRFVESFGRHEEPHHVCHLPPRSSDEPFRWWKCPECGQHWGWGRSHEPPVYGSARPSWRKES